MTRELQANISQILDGASDTCVLFLNDVSMHIRFTRGTATKCFYINAQHHVSDIGIIL